MTLGASERAGDEWAVQATFLGHGLEKVKGVLRYIRGEIYKHGGVCTYADNIVCMQALGHGI